MVKGTSFAAVQVGSRVVVRRSSSVVVVVARAPAADSVPQTTGADARDATWRAAARSSRTPTSSRPRCCAPRVGRALGVPRACVRACARARACVAAIFVVLASLLARRGRRVGAVARAGRGLCGWQSTDGAWRRCALCAAQNESAFQKQSMITIGLSAIGAWRFLLRFFFLPVGVRRQRADR